MLPLLYLHGLSTGDLVPALSQFLGSGAGLSGPVITKLTQTWQAEQRAFAQRDLSQAAYVYLWADGIHVNIRLEEHKLCLLVMIGVRTDGRKELVALADGYRESAGSWGTCCATASAAACAHPCWPSATARWDSGARCGKCSPRPGRAGAGCTRQPTFSRHCRSPRTRVRRKPWPRSGEPRTRTTPSPQ